MCIGPLAKDDSPEPDSHSLVWAAPTLDASLQVSALWIRRLRTSQSDQCSAYHEFTGTVAAAALSVGA